MPASSSCNPRHDRVDPASGLFLTDCDDTTFCSLDTNITAPQPVDESTTRMRKRALPTGSCKSRTCRADEWPFGYAADAKLPPLCASNEACPDEGSGCVAKKDIGEACQVGRDDQCSAPSRGNALCINSVCAFQNGTDKDTCSSESASYIVYLPGNITSKEVITRSTCLTGYYCDSTDSTCARTFALGTGCFADVQCQSGSCGGQGVCVVPTGLPRLVPTWTLIVASLGFAGLLAGLMIGLALWHTKEKRTVSRKQRKVDEQQRAYRRAIKELDRVANENAKWSAQEKSGTDCGATLPPDYQTRRTWSSPSENSSSSTTEWQTEGSVYMQEEAE